MKRTVAFFKCLAEVIEKKIYKSSKNDKSHGCEALRKFDAESASPEEKEHVEEYAYNYGLTTRWQTL